MQRRQGTSLGTSFEQLPVYPQAGRPRASCYRFTRRKQVARPQGSPARKALINQAKIAFSTDPTRLY
jgi:hypothetical protein